MRKIWICFTLFLFCPFLVSCGLSAEKAGNTVKMQEQTMESVSEEAEQTMESVSEEAEKAMESYLAFLENQDMYELTATPEYPRGDSTAKYAFGDCNGDGVPDLHISGGRTYRVYTCRDGEVELLRDFGYGWYPEIVPLKDGSFVGAGRYDAGLRDYPDAAYHSQRRIPPKDHPFAGMEWKRRSQEYYFYQKLNFEGYPMDSESRYFTREFQNGQDDKEAVYYIDRQECGKEEWERQIRPYRAMLEDTSLHLSWNFVFPESEWDYLDAMEEGNGLAEEGLEKEAWLCYERILSGDFSFIEEVDERSHMASKYEGSLDQDTGRSRWKYILLDFSGDGVKDLVVRFGPEEDDYTSADFSYGSSRGIAYFSFQDGKIDWWDFDISHESFIPLRNGQMIWWYGYGVTTGMDLGRMDNRRNFVREKGYSRLYVGYDDYMHDQSWYVETFGDRGKQEGIYYSTQDYDSSGEYVDSRDITEQEWREIELLLRKLLIPDGEWKPASVFLPNRYQEEFSVG